MEGDSTSAPIDSSSDKKKIGMDPGGGGGGDMDVEMNPVSTSQGDEESETDELTIDDSCVNEDNDGEEDMDDDDGEVALVSSSTFIDIKEDIADVRKARASGHLLDTETIAKNASTASNAAPSQPMDTSGEEESGPPKPRGFSLMDLAMSQPEPRRVPRPESPQITEHRTIAEDDIGIIRTNMPVTEQESNETEPANPEPVKPVEETKEMSESVTPESPPAGPESPTLSPKQPEQQATIGSPDPTSQDENILSPDVSSQERHETIGSPDVTLKEESIQGIDSPDHEETTCAPSPPKSPEHLTSTPNPSQSSKSPAIIGGGSPETETIISQENFSQLDTSAISLSMISSQSSNADKTLQSSQASAKSEQEAATVDEDTMDTSQVESSSQAGTQESPSMSEMDNDESQQSSIVAPPSEKSISNGTVSKSRSKSRSRSNTVEDVDDVDLEDGEIMDDEEEEKQAPAPAKESKRDREKEKSKSSSSSKEKEREKEKERKERKEEKEREKEKHRKEKKRSKREEEKEREKEKEKEKDKKNKKRKASDADSEQEEYLFIRGASPGSAAPPLPPDPWSTPVEEFGDDSKVSRAKRRRESDGDNNSPHHHPHHHASVRPTREPSPPPQARRGTMPNDNRDNKRPMRDAGRKEQKSDVICAYFMQGKCQKSAMECSFSHDAVPPRKMELCKFWMMECCAKKEKCLYLHNDFPCKYYHTGLICKAGDRCKFSHNPLSDVTKQVLLKHIETAPKEILGDFPRLNRQGAINLINKMEARLRGEKVDDDRDGYSEMNHNDHHGRGPPIPPPHERHHGHGRNDDRHGGGRSGRDHHGGHLGHGHGHAQHGHHGHGPPPRGNNDMRGGPPGRVDDRHHNNNRGSRWEQHPTRDDQEKLQELMEEAGISGFYKDTLESGGPPGPPPVNQPPPGPPPGGFPGMQPGLLPLNPVLMQQMLPGLIPQTQPNAVNNPALANVLASLNLPNTSIAPPTTLAAGLPLNTPINVPPPIVPSQASEDSNLSSDGKTVPDHLPKMQQELFKRIQMQQQKNEKKMQHLDKPEPEEQEENWYSSEDEDDSVKKKNDNKTEISDKISSVLNQIRQQTKPSTSVLPPSMSLPPENKPPSSFYGDTDFRNQPPTFKDVDLRNPSSIFKKIDIEPAKEINASLAHNGPFPYKVRKVAGIPKIDYSTVRIGLPPSSILLDPRLAARRNNSIPAPASPTETPTPDVGLQPLTIPDGTPVFDPRTLRGGGSGQGSSGGRGAGITPQQNNPFLDSDNSLPNSGVNDFPSLFNRDPRGGGGGAPVGNQGGPGGVPPGSQAQNLAAMAAAMAAMQQMPPGMQPPGLDPNLLMMGFPFLPQQPGGVQNPLDFQQMLAAGGAASGNLRMRPPFPPPQQASSSWERLNQGQQGGGGGDLTPPL